MELTRTPVTESPVTVEPRVETPVDKTFTVTNPSEMPPSLYQEAKKVPYVLDVLEAPQIFKQFDYKYSVSELDRFINSEVSRRGLGDTKDSYKTVLDDLMKNIKGDSVYMQVDRLIEWARIQSKLIQVAKDKEEFLKKPVEEMTVAELKKVIRGNQ